MARDLVYDLEGFVNNRPLVTVQVKDLIQAVESLNDQWFTERDVANLLKRFPQCFHINAA
jgi:hypothetical protein